MQQAFAFDKQSLIKIGKSALIVAGGAGLTYALQELAKMDFGVYTPLATAFLAWAINTVREYVRGA